MVKINVDDSTNQELIERIVVRMGDQAEPEIIHVLSQLFPNSPAMRLRSVAVDMAEKRMNALGEFKNLLESDEVNEEIFNSLSSADRDPSMIFARSQYDPYKFELTLECARTPFKEFFAECRDITCENCIKNRVLNFQTDNKNSKQPWTLRVDRTEKSRIDLCKNCNRLLDKNDDINMQKERLLYTCSKCGHSGWNTAK